MKYTKQYILSILSLIILSLPAFSQQLTGKATYLSDRDMTNLSFEGANHSPEMVEQLKAQLKKQFQKEYELEFNLSESTWKEAESLDAGAATASSGGMTISIATGNSITYKNTSDLTYIEQTESFSKLFLIKDSLKQRQWKITGETKKIGNYLANKATYENIRESKTFSLTNDDKEMKSKIDTTLITVWYSSQIPVPHGPSDYWGLPGLILEMTDGNVTYLCTKVVLNPTDKIIIKAPTKGKEVTRKEYEKVNEKMAESMMKKYRGNGEATTIKIGN